MNRTFTSFVACLFVGFLLLGVGCVVQNILQDIQRTATYCGKTHILAYKIEV